MTFVRFLTPGSGKAIARASVSSLRKKYFLSL